MLSLPTRPGQLLLWCLKNKSRARLFKHAMQLVMRPYIPVLYTFISYPLRALETRPPLSQAHLSAPGGGPLGPCLTHTCTRTGRRFFAYLASATYSLALLCERNMERTLRTHSPPSWWDASWSDWGSAMLSRDVTEAEMLTPSRRARTTLRTASESCLVEHASCLCVPVFFLCGCLFVRLCLCVCVLVVCLFVCLFVCSSVRSYVRSFLC